MKLFSVADFKTYAEINDTKFDAMLAVWIDGISERAQAFMGRTLPVQTNAVEKFDLPASTLFVKSWPITAIASITILGTSMGASGYVWSPTGGFIRFVTAPSEQIPILIVGENYYPDGVEVTYSGGYAYNVGIGLTDVLVGLPGDLVSAVKRQLLYEFQTRKGVGQSSVAMPDGSISMYENEEWLPEVRSVLKRHSRGLGAL
jgi:hypothetical protein